MSMENCANTKPKITIIPAKTRVERLDPMSVAMGQKPKISCKNPFCAIVKGLRFSKASEEQIPTAILEETTKRVNCHENGNLPLFCIKKTHAAEFYTLLLRVS